MEYDPIKDVIAVPMRKCPRFRRLAYKLFECGFLRVRHVNRQLKHLAKQLPPQPHVLDAGFGFGPYTDLLLRERDDLRITGYEVKDDQVRDCETFFRKEGFGDRANFAVLDLVDLADENEYDLIVAVDIMEHIEDDVTVMRNFRRALKPGGVLYIHTPSSHTDSRTEEHPEQYFVGEHVREGFHPQEMREKLKEAGFDRVELRFDYGRYGMWAWWIMQGIPMRILDKAPFLAVLLPFYYACKFPIANRLMVADLAESPEWGGGLMARAWVNK